MIYLYYYLFIYLFISSRIAGKRKQLIANSKYLGGDMEHTHLVKGLDYALLQKVRLNTKTYLLLDLTWSRGHCF